MKYLSLLKNVLVSALLLACCGTGKATTYQYTGTDLYHAAMLRSLPVKHGPTVKRSIGINRYSNRLMRVLFIRILQNINALPSMALLRQKMIMTGIFI